MRLVVFRPRASVAELWRTGTLLDGERILDLEAAHAAHREANTASSRTDVFERFPRTTVELLAASGGLALAAKLTDWAAESRDRERDGTPVVYPFAECVLDAPVRPTKIITIARNYREHLAESGVTDVGPVPSASIKATSSVTGPYDDIVRPRVESQLDYETELAIVIGTRCKHVRECDAYGVIAGYTVLSDIVARQVLATERRAGNQFLGKMFDTFGPMGPWIVMRDEIEDPMDLRITTRVNGETRQDGKTSAMIWSIPKLVAYFSQATLYPGDIISTGTPAGVAAGRRPGEEPWFLKPGDIIESSVEKIGTLRNHIVQEAPHDATWSWPDYTG